MVPSIGLFLLRVSISGMLIVWHGWPKIESFADRLDSFPDPLGVGTPLSLSLAIFAEVLCALLVMLGLATRLAAIPVVVNMSVAAFMVHMHDPWSKKEFALLYALPFLALVFTGAGRLSLDHVWLRSRRRRG